MPAADGSVQDARGEILNRHYDFGLQTGRKAVIIVLSENHRRTLMLTNYHTHCDRCQHAEGSVEDYVKQAIIDGFGILGMSDHLPYPHHDYGFRMDFAEIWDYIYDVRECQEKYGNRIQVLLGFESEYLRSQRRYYEELLTEYGAQYLVLGQHFFEADGDLKSAYYLSDTADCVAYARSISEALDTGCYSLLAHPDIVGVCCLEWDRHMDEMTDIIIDSALRNRVPLEINANGVRRGYITDSLGAHYMYPHFKFWEKVAESGAEVVISADCHTPALLSDSAMDKCRTIARNWRLNVVEELSLSKIE